MIGAAPTDMRTNITTVTIRTNHTLSICSCCIASPLDRKQTNRGIAYDKQAGVPYAPAASLEQFVRLERALGVRRDVMGYLQRSALIRSTAVFSASLNARCCASVRPGSTSHLRNSGLA
jgi:hypothetical protein